MGDKPIVGSSIAGYFIAGSSIAGSSIADNLTEGYPTQVILM